MTDLVGAEAQKTRTMYGVEYYSQLPSEIDTTFEIFETIKAAKAFASRVAVLYLFMADFNLEHIFQEDNGTWNYEDFSDTFENQFILETNNPEKSKLLAKSK